MLFPVTLIRLLHCFSTKKRKILDINRLNSLGAYTSIFILSVCSLIFISRLFNSHVLEYYLGIVLLLTAFPLLYLFFSANQFSRPLIYYIQLTTMISYLIVELLLDYTLKIDFRSNQLIVIPYVVLFFAGTGGMIGIASLAGKIWLFLAIALFICLTILAFFQRAITGM